MPLANTLHRAVSHLHDDTSDQSEVEVALLCADVVGFARMTEHLGDRRSLAVMQRIARLIRSRITNHVGTELEVRGDLFLIAFASPLRAVACATSIQRGLARDAAAHPGESVQVRISVHTGTVLREGEGYFGRNVIIPFRLLSRTEGQQIAVTSAVSKRLDDGWQPLVKGAHSFRPKGFQDEISFGFVDWSNDACTQLSRRESLAVSAVGAPPTGLNRGVVPADPEARVAV
jgi:class 3 adenylate cyclase